MRVLLHAPVPCAAGAVAHLVSRQRWIALALLLPLAACEKVPDQLCGKDAGKPLCCVVTTGADEYASTCVGSLEACKELASGSPYTTNVTKNDNVDKIRSCVTRWKKKFWFDFSGSNIGAPDDQLVALEDSAGQVLRVAFSDRPIDCQRACDEGLSEFCKSFSSTAEIGAQLTDFRSALSHGVAVGTVEMDEVHRIFQIADGADPCDRSSITLSSGKLMNSGPKDCELTASIEVANRTLPVKVIVPATVEASLGLTDGDSVDSVHFDTPEKSLNLVLGDADLQRRWGGQIRRVQAASDALMVSTSHSCLRIGLRPQQLQARIAEATP
ncbi:MAG TPA: hypothetical protein VJQ52_06610 [Steroidobacteraceae bacterium]|nr:hypothetical protein [Steroidobacteraceae bacterium]